jgi:tetratricopeptide (TPR) repeat protein
MDQLPQALVLLQTEDIKLQYKEHRQNLESVLRAFRSTESYRKRQQLERARTTLDALYQKLDPIRDAPLLSAVQRKLNEVENQSRSITDHTVKDLLARAEAQLHAKKYDEAVASFTEVAGRRPSEVSEALIQQGEQGKLRAETARLEAQNPGFWSDLAANLAKGLLTIAQWLVYFGVLILVVAAIFLVPKFLPPHKGVILSLTDLTCAAESRAVSSQGLMQEVVGRILALGQQPDDVAQIDWYEDLDNASLGNLRVLGDELAKIEALIDDAAIHVGVVAFSPRQLFNFLRLSFRRPYQYTLRGSLEKRGDLTSLTVERVDRDGKPEAGKRWEKECSGATARVDVILSIATRIAFDLADYKITSSWRSFEAYRQGMVHLGQEEQSAKRADCLNSASDAFQRSLLYDESNWMARFNCATVLRKLGRNEPAAGQFAFLERMVEGKDTGRPPSLTTFLNRHPDFPEVVRYNRAVALSKSADRALQEQGRKLIEALIEKLSEMQTARADARTAPSKRAVPAEPPVHEIATAAEEKERQATTESDTARAEVARAGQALQRALRLAKDDPAGDEGVANARTVLADAQAKASDAKRRAREATNAFTRAAAAARAADKPGESIATLPRQGTLIAPVARRANAIRLKWLANSALAAMLAEELEYLRDQSGDEKRLQERRNRIFDRLRDLKDRSESLPQTPESDWSIYPVVLATVHNAFGRACYLIGRYRESIDVLHRVINTSPAFIDAYVNLAQVYMHLKDQFYIEWIARTEMVLKKVIELSPTHQKAHYILAKLYAEPGVQKYAQAKEHLDSAGSNPANDALRARILHDEHHLDGALEVFKRSLAVFSKPDYRFGLYVDYLLEAAGPVNPDRQKLHLAAEVAKRLKEGGTRPSERKWGDRLLRKIQSLVSPPPDYCI